MARWSRCGRRASKRNSRPRTVRPDTDRTSTGAFPYLTFDLADLNAPARLAYPVVNDLVTVRPIWTADRPAGRLAALLGRTRRAILESIAVGCSTVELARRLGISPASVSHHTAVLRNSGLISTRRDGASVIHTVTNLGAILLDPTKPASRHLS